MPVQRKLYPEPIFDEDALRKFLVHDCEVKATHMQNLWKHLLRTCCKEDEDNVDFAKSVQACTNLPHRVKETITSQFELLTSRLVEEKTSADKTTTKMVIQLQDGHLIEAVIMRHVVVGEEGEVKKLAGTGKRHHVTLCVSSQVGCAMGCTFCATGTLGLLANLTAGEILEQIVHANRIEKVSNIVFMGMGEPLNNYKAVSSALKLMTDVSLFGLAPSRVTVSTVGIIPNMRALSKDFPSVNLALSLHAPTQEVRKKIVPAARGFPIENLIQALDDHLAKRTNKHRHVLIEYILIADVNDSDEMAHKLGKLMQGKAVKVNVIPYNPTSVNYDFKPPRKERVVQFLKILMNEYKVNSLERREMGQDIAGACGQLAINGGNGLDTAAAKRGLGPGGGGCGDGGDCGGGGGGSDKGEADASVDIEDLINPVPSNLPPKTKRLPSRVRLGVTGSKKPKDKGKNKGGANNPPSAPTKAKGAAAAAVAAMVTEAANTSPSRSYPSSDFDSSTPFAPGVRAHRSSSQRDRDMKMFVIMALLTLCLLCLVLWKREPEGEL